MIKIGQLVTLGWNGASDLGNAYLAENKVRVEAFGCDWVVVRCSEGDVYSAAYRGFGADIDIISELES